MSLHMMVEAPSPPCFSTSVLAARERLSYHSLETDPLRVAESVDSLCQFLCHNFSEVSRQYLHMMELM